MGQWSRGTGGFCTFTLAAPLVRQRCVVQCACLGGGPCADAAVSRCCRDAAAGAAALTLRASSSERHRGGAGGDAAGTEKREAADIAGLGSVTCRRPDGFEALIPTLQLLAPPEPGMGGLRRRRVGGGSQSGEGSGSEGAVDAERTDLGAGAPSRESWLGDSEEAIV